jgi:hypothetical protein
VYFHVSSCILQYLCLTKSYSCVSVMCQKCANGLSIRMVHLCVSSMSDVCNMAYQYTQSRISALATLNLPINSNLIPNWLMARYHQSWSMIHITHLLLQVSWHKESFVWESNLLFQTELPHLAMFCSCRCCHNNWLHPT